MTRPRILFYTTQTDFTFWGGSEKFWFETILHPRFRERFACSVVLPDTGVTRAHGRQLEALGAQVEWYPLGIRRPSLAARVVREAGYIVTGGNPNPEQKRWVKWIEAYRPSLVWLNLSSAYDLGATEQAVATCRRTGVPYWLIVQHSSENLFFRDDAHTERYASIVEGASRVAFVSERNRVALEHALGRSLRNSWRAFNAVRHDWLERAAAMARDRPVRSEGKARLLSLARFSPAFKGQHILLEVLSQRNWQTRDWGLAMQGWGSLASLLKRLIEYYGLDPVRVQVLAESPDPLGTIVGSDLLVMPSLSEGMPFAMVEAMACGRPAVGTPVAGIPELILDGETGWLARSTEVGDVAEALERAWQARRQWRICGQTAQTRVMNNYDQDRTIGDLMHALDEDACPREG